MDLSELFKPEAIPDERRCRMLMDQYAVLPNIVAHSYRVCQTACFLTGKLNRTGKIPTLNLALVLASSLLHDITKTRSLQTGEDHSETGGDLLLRLGFPQLAEIVRRHVRLTQDQLSAPLTEVHVVNYSDKRVLHETVVSLDERFSYLLARYGKDESARERIGRLKMDILTQEERLFASLGFQPHELEAFNSLPVFDLIHIPPTLEKRSLS